MDAGQQFVSPNATSMDSVVNSISDPTFKAIAKHSQEESQENKEFTKRAIAREEANVFPVPPQHIEPPKPADYTTPPMETFGSAAMMVAALGSLLTKSSATTALNSATGVMKAVNQKDTNSFNQAMAKYKVDVENMKMDLDYQVKLYEAIKDKPESEQRMMLAASKDDTGRIAIDAKNYGAHMKMLKVQQKAVSGTSEKIEERERRHKMYLDQGMSDADAMTKSYDETFGQSAQTKMTAAVKSQTDGINDAIKNIDDAIALARTHGKGGLPLGGSLSGMVNTAAEAGGAAMGEKGSPESGYKAKLGLIKEEAVTALGAGKKLGKDERENIYSMIPTGGLGVTNESQIAGLEELKQKLQIKKREITNNPQSYEVDDVITRGGQQYRVINADDPNDPDVELIK